tara:strand:+ start:515 stop:946 length:432 start_codon:yes stop_codon:yes gene_type:complete
MGSDANIDELHIYLHEIADTPFKWGRHDCFLFTNTAFKKMYGEGWADDWAHRYLGSNRLPFKRSILQSEYGFETFEEAVDTKLTRVENVPPRGALVTTSDGIPRSWYVGVVMGIAVGSSAAFLSSEGVIYLPIETIDNAWVKA